MVDPNVFFFLITLHFTIDHSVRRGLCPLVSINVTKGGERVECSVRACVLNVMLVKMYKESLNGIVCAHSFILENIFVRTTVTQLGFPHT